MRWFSAGGHRRGFRVCLDRTEIASRTGYSLFLLIPFLGDMSQSWGGRVYSGCESGNTASSILWQDIHLGCLCLGSRPGRGLTGRSRMGQKAEQVNLRLIESRLCCLEGSALPTCPLLETSQQRASQEARLGSRPHDLRRRYLDGPGAQPGSHSGSFRSHP